MGSLGFAFDFCLVVIRLKNATPVSYTEVPLKKDESMENRDIVMEEGAKPEVYTEEHEKLLGNTEKSWTLFVDGCGKDGKRIYDPVKGKTCHQCRLAPPPFTQMRRN